jgi:hypothetical protein
MIINLKSVEHAIDSTSLMCYPFLLNGITYDVAKPTHLSNCSKEWLEKLDTADTRMLIAIIMLSDADEVSKEEMFLSLPEVIREHEMNNIINQ